MENLENDAGAGNAPATPAARAVDKLRSAGARPAAACSPVQEEEEFASGAQAEKLLAREHSRAMQSSAQARRNTMSNIGATRKPSLGGASLRSGQSGTQGGRRSIGGSQSVVSSGSGGSEADRQLAAQNRDLVEELLKRQESEQTRQSRLNSADIKVKQLEAQVKQLEAELREKDRRCQEYAKRDLEVKKRLNATGARLAKKEAELEQEKKTSSKLLAQLHKNGPGPSYLRKGSGKPEGSAATPSAAGVVQGAQPSSTGIAAATPAAAPAAPAASCAAAAADDDFAPADQAIPLARPADDPNEPVRRYTIAPGEVHRRSTALSALKNVVVRESHTIRIDGLQPSWKSKDLMPLCGELGTVVNARVTRDVITGELKGYVMFLEPEMARSAVVALKARNHKVVRVDDV
jgi:hypothetical protein